MNTNMFLFTIAILLERLLKENTFLKLVFISFCEKDLILISLKISYNFNIFCIKVVDYSIARKIIDLHTNLEESYDRAYSLADIQLYILVARQLKPKVCNSTILNYLMSLDIKSVYCFYYCQGCHSLREIRKLRELSSYRKSKGNSGRLKEVLRLKNLRNFFFWI